MSIFGSAFDEDIFAPIFPRVGIDHEEEEIAKALESLTLDGREQVESYDDLGNIDLSKVITQQRHFGSRWKSMPDLKDPRTTKGADFANTALYDWTAYTSKHDTMQTLVLGPRRYFPSYYKSK